MVETHLIEAFVEVVQRGSVTAAAKALNRSQPAISHRLRQLEAVVGSQLLEPDGRGVRLTAAGERFHRTAAPLLAQLRALPGSAATEPTPLVVGVSHSLAAHVAGAWSEGPEQQSLHITTHDDAGLGEFFSTSGCAGAFSSSPPPPGIAADEVGVWKLLLVRGAHELDERYMQWSGDEGASAASRAAGDSYGLHSALHVNRSDVLLSLVARGLGRAILPAYVTGARVREIEVLDESLDVRVYWWRGSDSVALQSLAESLAIPR